MTEIVDLHCHILPYVDDGALREGESIELLDMMVKQGVRTICTTPHLRKDMFETADEDIQERFEKLKNHSDTENKVISLFLSREYHCDDLFFEKLQDRKLIPMGERTVLLEFSSRHSADDIKKGISAAMEQGFSPLIAHAERYPTLQGNIDLIHLLIEAGARLQMNIGSLLGREGFRRSLWAKKLLKEKLIYVLASDAHDPVDRPPEWDTCIKLLKRLTDESYITEIVKTNAEKILMTKKENDASCR